MLIRRLKKFFWTYRKNQLPPIHQNKHYYGILLTALGWFLIWISVGLVMPHASSLNYYNFCFYQHTIAFMTLGLWAGLKGKMCFFSKNPGGVIMNSLFVVLSFILFFYLRIKFSGSPHFNEGSFFLNSDGIFVALFGLIALKQDIPKPLWVGLGLIFLGTYWIQSPSFNFFPEPLEITTSLLYPLILSLLVISSNYLIRNGNSPVVICLYNTLFNFLCFGLVSISIGFSAPSPLEFLVAFICGVLYAFAIVLFTSAHRYTEFYYIMPVHSMIYIYPFIFSLLAQKRMPLLSLFGVLFLLLGLTFVIRKKKTEKEKLPLVSVIDTAA